MKQKLLILSLAILFGCENNKSNTNKEAPINLVADFFNEVLKENVDLSNSIDELLITIDTTSNGIRAYGLENEIDPGKILFIASEKTILSPFTEEANANAGSARTFGSYSVWLYDNLEFSVFPNPTKEWVFMIRER